MGWGDLWSSFGGFGTAAGSGGGVGMDGGTSLGGVGPSWYTQQQLLDQQPAGAMGPMLPQKNLGLPDVDNGLTADPNKGGLGRWMRETGPGNLKGPEGGMGGGGMAQALQGAQGMLRQAQPAAAAAPHAPGMAPPSSNGGGGMAPPPQQLPPLAIGNPYISAAPYARRALQLQRGLLDG